MNTPVLLKKQTRARTITRVVTPHAPRIQRAQLRAAYLPLLAQTLRAWQQSGRVTVVNGTLRVNPESKS